MCGRQSVLPATIVTTKNNTLRLNLMGAGLVAGDEISRFYHAHSRLPPPRSGRMAGMAPKPRIAWRLPPPLWVKVGIIPPALYILAMFVLGLPPLSGMLEYEREIPISEVIDYAWTEGLKGTFDYSGIFYVATFLPMAAVGLVAFLCLRHQRPLGYVIVANITLPAIWLAFFWPIFVVIGPLLLVEALAGRSDGETWSEGFICYAAIGSWTTMWLAVAIVAIALGTKPAIQFSLRAMLIATTLIAVVLGLGTWLAS
jgi:hypothetical protein